MASVKDWLTAVADAKKREKDWREAGREALCVYNGEKPDQIPFNILYSNTETLIPALYNSSPRPVVQRRFKDDDPIGRAAAEVGQRLLGYSIDTNSDEYEPFDDVMGDAVVDALLPSRAVSRARYDASILGGVVQSEQLCYESVKWDRISFGFARKWAKVPWLAFDHDIDKVEATRLFGAEKIKNVVFAKGEKEEEEDDEKRKGTSVDKTENERETARFYEIWDKDAKEVLWINESIQDGPVSTSGDPLGLTGFFPIPTPLRFLRKSNDQSPTVIYELYKNQAKELNRITVRINRIVDALKVRGIYDGTLGDEIAELLKLDDNQMAKATNVAALQDTSLEKSIWMFPIDKLIVVLQQLIVAREQCKKVIYEITGVSDILRGQSVASETATAQQIKNQWGTLRLKRLQRDVQNYARGLLRIGLEIAANKFSVETVKKMTGLSYPTAQEKQIATMAAAQAQQNQQPLDPNLQDMLAKPTWEEIMVVLKDDTQRQYKIDIETNSTIDLEATEDQKNITEFMGGVSQFLSGVSPLVESGVLPFQAAQSILLAVVRRFRFGTEVEDQIKAMGPPKPKDDGKAAQAQLDAQMKQADLQQREVQNQREMQQRQVEEQNRQTLEIAKIEAKARLDEQNAARAHALTMATLARQERLDMAKIQAEKEIKAMEAEQTRQTEQMKANITATTNLKIAAMDNSTKLELGQLTAQTAVKTAETSADASLKTAETGAKAQKEVAATKVEGDAGAKVAELMKELMAAVTAPKTIERGKDGRALRLVSEVG